mgnify:CR=1 FL=1
MSETCPTCRGTGRTYGMPCWECDGDGNVPQQEPTPKPSPKG